MFVEYKKAIEENVQWKQERDELQTNLRRAEKAKENYKEQTLDLKQEVRMLK